MEPQTPLICPSHTTQYIGVLIAGIALGVGATFVIGGGTYQAGFNDAKKVVNESPAGMMFHTPDDIRTVSGTVTAVNGNRITIHTQSPNPFDDPALADRIVTITSETKITKTEQMDPKALQAEMEAYMKKLQSSKGATATPPTPPMPTKTPVEASSIKAGDNITATATENIKTKKEFSASEISVLSALEPLIQERK